MRLRFRLTLLVVLSSLCAASEAVAIYKYRLADGSILYSQTPGRRGVLLQVMNIPASGAAQLATQRRAQQQLERDIVRAERMTALRAMYPAPPATACGNVQALVINDDTPRPGERTGIVGGRSRLNEAYWQRLHGNASRNEFVLDAYDPARTEHARLK